MDNLELSEKEVQEIVNLIEDKHGPIEMEIIYDPSEVKVQPLEGSLSFTDPTIKDSDTDKE